MKNRNSLKSRRCNENSQNYFLMHFSPHPDSDEDIWMMDDEDHPEHQILASGILRTWTWKHDNLQ